ncbi:MAG TPA: L-seryl-tRNA(Sec) selenium transferase [Dehalococcoidia bacterium]|nr:L-seryl-tRNA(Sec) selenium transferase [Dehalococcoidia bacterium]
MSSPNPLRALPSVDRVLADPRLEPYLRRLRPDVVTDIVRRELARIRDAMRAGERREPPDDVAAGVVARLDALTAPSLRRVVNATGVILHTNLGRAPLADEALEAMALASAGYSNLEFDLHEGVRGSRFVHLEAALTALTGAQAAIAVNNNAAAVLLALAALCRDREVIVSRGQLVEIGGGFRIPDVMRQSGAILVEVGTTNRTRLADYANAITERTAALLRVHASNFRIVGFTETVPIEALASLARERGLLLIDDLGSGALLDTAAYGLAHEPMPQESVAAGADVVLFSGDKLLGGPQAGIAVGRRDPIERMRRHPLARAVRMDKASIAGLAATLQLYLAGQAAARVPVWRMIATPVPAIARRARRWAREVGGGATVIESRSMVGGGSLPEESLPTRALAVEPPAGVSADELAQRLRRHDPPVIARIERDRLVLDPRTVDPRDDAVVIAALRAATAAG